MAKGRKLTISRSERYLYGYNNGQVAAAESPELREDDVWPAINNDDQNNIYDEWGPRHESNMVRHSRGTAASGRHTGGLSLAFDDDSETVAASRRIVHRGTDSPRGGRHVATSAPVNVPDWSNIYRADSGESLHDSDDVDDNNDYEMVPPHEYLAREYRKMNTTSVLEGAGRTLKGRDLSRVRDAVWSQTGFDG